MGLNFPVSPTTGQKFPAPSIVGIPTYTWDGEKWTTAGPAVGALYVAKAGDLMSGDLAITKDTPALTLTNNVASSYSKYPWIVSKQGANITWSVSMGAGPNSDYWGVDRYDNSGVNTDSPIVINRADGLVILTANPTSAMGAATKQYVDTKVPVAATGAEYINNSAPTKMLTSGAVWGAAGQILTLSDASGTIAFDMNATFDFITMLSGAGRSLPNPTNQKGGQKGIIYLQQDATGGRTITTWGSAFKFTGGTKPALSTAANAIDVISYAVLIPNSIIVCTFSPDYK